MSCKGQYIPIAGPPVQYDNCVMFEAPHWLLESSVLLIVMAMTIWLCTCDKRDAGWPSASACSWGGC